MPFAVFESHLRARVELHLGDITEPHCGLSEASRVRLFDCVKSVIHVAASLNRRSERLCLNVNQRGTLHVIELARMIHERRGLRRFSDVSTTAVAGERSHEVVREDDAIDWSRRDYDPYARTKKFCEHMVETLLADVPCTVFRPSTVIGDTRFGASTQFDMVRAVLTLARMKVVPLHPDARHDIVPADYVGHAIADIHQREAPKHRIYHLSAGESAETHEALMARLRVNGRALPHKFAPALEQPFGRLVGALADTPRGLGISGPASLLKVFWPYVVFDTVFDNRRVVEELGVAPKPFSAYAPHVLDFALEHGFAYPYLPWPESSPSLEAAPSPA
jgi:nucleoside-diphosphate-sugar epimerase